MGVHVIRPAFNLEPKYRVTMLSREEWTRGPGTPPVVRGLVWFTDGSKTMNGTGAVVCGRSLGSRLSIPLGKYATVFQAEVYAILTCVYEIQMNVGPEKYMSIYSDSQAALKAIQAAKRNVSADTTVPKGIELYLYPTHSGTVLGSWTCWGMRKRNRRQACKGWFCSEICQT
jgi:RNase H.